MSELTKDRVERAIAYYNVELATCIDCASVAVSSPEYADAEIRNIKTALAALDAVRWRLFGELTPTEGHWIYIVSIDGDRVDHLVTNWRGRKDNERWHAWLPFPTWEVET